MIGSDPEPPDELDEPQSVEIVDTDEKPNEGGGDALAASSSSLTRRDPLAAYMRDVQRYSLLSKEEEHDLAVRFLEDDDLEAAKRLVTSNLRLVVKIAYDSYRQRPDLTLVWIKAHVGYTWNEYADELANKARAEG